MREFAVEHGVTHFYEGGQVGVEHALLPEKGIVLPGDLVIGADSHTCTYGALGAFATGVGSTDLAAAMLTGELWFKVPESIKFVVYGKLCQMGFRKGSDSEYHRTHRRGRRALPGDGIHGRNHQRLPMADRLSMANMAIEAGAKNGIFPPDAITEAYVEPTGQAALQILYLRCRCGLFANH